MNDVDPKAAVLAILAGIAIAVIVYFVLAAISKILLVAVSIAALAVGSWLIYRRFVK